MSAILVDFKNTYQVSAGLNPDTYTTSQNGTGVDFQPTDGQCFAILQVKSHDRADGDETLAVKVQESDDNSTFTDVSGGGFTTISTATGAAVQVINFTRTKRYLRAVSMAAGTTPSDKFGVIFFSRKKISGSGAGSQVT